MADGHAGPAAVRGGAQFRSGLMWAFGVVAAYSIVELAAGLATSSLALLADAGHMFTDVLGLGMSVAAIQAADRVGDDEQRTFGLYRLEILAALANAALLFVVSSLVLFEAVRRFREPPAVPGAPMLLVAVAGLGVNIGTYFLLRRGTKHSINVEAAVLEVLADAVGSIATIMAAGIILTTGFRLADPLFGVALGLFVLPRAWRLGRKAVRILIQGAPPELDVREIGLRLEEIPGVLAVHDLHVWTLTSGMEVGSVHLRLEPGAGYGPVHAQATKILRGTFGVEHLTIQLEPPEMESCSEAEAHGSGHGASEPAWSGSHHP